MSVCYERAYASQDLSLNAKRDIKNSEERISGLGEKELKQRFGPEWYYSVDFVELYTSLIKYVDPTHDYVCKNWAERLGEVVGDYLIEMGHVSGSTWDEVSREALSKDAFSSKVHRKVICLKLTEDKISEDENRANTDPKKGLYGNFEYEDGAFVVYIRLQRFAVNCGYALEGWRVMKSL